MQTLFNYADIDNSDALETHANEQIEHHITRRFGERITRVEVHLSDTNAEKHGPRDKRCRIEARPSGRDPVFVEAHDDDFYKSIAECVDKLRKALEKRLERD